MKKRNGIILAVIGYIVFFFCMEGWGADWKYIGKDVGGSAFFDTETIKSLPNGNFMVWAKKVHSKEGISEIVKQYGEEYRNLNPAIRVQKEKLFD